MEYFSPTIFFPKHFETFYSTVKKSFISVGWFQLVFFVCLIVAFEASFFHGFTVNVKSRLLFEGVPAFVGVLISKKLDILK